jgi:3-oxoacyl-[acyl-carrier protein] reductase
VITNLQEHADESIRRLEAAGVAHAAVVCDALDESALVAAIDELKDELGVFRHLVNNLGGAYRFYWTYDSDMAEFDRTINLNLRYAVVASREFARQLIDAGQGGSIVNVSSSAERGSPLLGAYGAAKAGLSSFSRTMALELGPYGIWVNVVEPGAISRPNHTPEEREEMGAAALKIPLRRMGTAVDIANAVLFLLSDMACYITGHTLTLDGGMAMGYPDGPSPFIPVSLRVPVA